MATDTLISPTLDEPTAPGPGARAAGGGWGAEPNERPDRYEDRGLLHRSNLSEVRRVYDRDLERLLAKKIVLPGLSPGAAARFRREAVLTARLNHPGVIPILDRGVTADGRHFYYMPLMAWRTLEGSVVPGGLPDDTQLRHRVERVRDICNIVGYAHTEHRIVHCDLKPSNVLVGEHGEVMVLDWGLAVALDTPDGEDLRSGTPGYRPPEQARGESARVGPWSDVYALGATLYAILRLRAPPDWPGRPRPEELPEGLDAVCRRALDPDPERRYPDAQALGQALSDWLDGVFRRQRALEEVARARALDTLIVEAGTRATALRAQARELLAGLRPYDPVDRKRAGWAKEDEAEQVEGELARARAQRVQILRGALVFDADLPEAHALLADVHRAAHERAEAVGDRAEAARHEEALRVHDRVGLHAAYLAGAGFLSLRTTAPGAEVLWDELVEVDRRLVPHPRGALGRTPLDHVSLPRGSHQLRLRLPGHEEVVYPVRVGRAEHWNGVPPDTLVPAAVWLPPTGALGPGERYVPAGWFRSGGDGAAPEGLSPRRLWVDAFVITRHPVTVAEYFAFLNALLDAGREEEALVHAPRDQDNIAFARDGDGRFVPGGGPFGGEQWGLDWPVVLVSWEDASAYARWRAQVTGLPWRLPHDQEREKAARGVDGRLYPWGSFGERTWTNMADSTPGAPTRVSVHALPDDVGPYGVCGMAGNVRDWCANAYDREGPPDGARVDPWTPLGDPAHRFARGGAANAVPRFCRVDARFASAPDRRSSAGGFRLVRSVP